MTLADRATFIKDLIFSMQVSFPNLSFSFIFRHGEEGRLLALGPLVAGVAPRRKAMTLPSAIRHWLSLANTAAKHHTASTARAAETPRFFTSKVELKKHAATRRNTRRTRPYSRCDCIATTYIRDLSTLPASRRCVARSAA